MSEVIELGVISPTWQIHPYTKEEDMPPASIVIASIWLTSGILFGLARFTAEYFNSSQNPIQTGWFVWITFLASTNLVSVLLYFRRMPKAHIYYYGTLILLFLSGTIFFVTLARSGQQAGAFAAQCLTGALIFTISYLPYRDHFAKKNNSIVKGAANP